MDFPQSQLERNRVSGKHQLEHQRERILDAAEAVFLEKGLDATAMVDIAARAGITKITLYRYFPNRDTIALEIHTRMIARLSHLMDQNDPFTSLETERELIHLMIRNFVELRDVYRYMGMFDHVYLDRSAETGLAQWTKRELMRRSVANHVPVPAGTDNRFLMVISTVVWFLEKLALRGELTWSDVAVPLDTHLALFEEMILGYLGRGSLSESKQE